MFKKIRKLRLYITFFILPAFAVYTAFMAMPLFNSLRLSFYTGVGYVPKEFVGFQNYLKLFTQFPYNDRFFGALLNSLEFIAIIFIAQNIIAFTFSVIVTRKFFGARFFRVVFYIPTTISVLVIGFLFALMLNPAFGIFDKLLEFLGLGFLIRPWLGDTLLALPVIAVIASWHHLGTPLLFFSATIDRIPDEIMEAAKVDGVTVLGMVRHIIYPLLIPIIRLITILTFVINFIGFDIIYAMSSVRGDPSYSADLPGTFFYRTAFGDRQGAGPDMGLGAAVASILFILSCLGVLFIFLIFRRQEEGGLQ